MSTLMCMYLQFTALVLTIQLLVQCEALNDCFGLLLISAYKPDCYFASNNLFHNSSLICTQS